MTKMKQQEEYKDMEDYFKNIKTLIGDMKKAVKSVYVMLSFNAFLIVLFALYKNIMGGSLYSIIIVWVMAMVLMISIGEYFITK